MTTLSEKDLELESFLIDENMFNYDRQFFDQEENESYAINDEHLAEMITREQTNTIPHNQQSLFKVQLCQKKETDGIQRKCYSPYFLNRSIIAYFHKFINNTFDLQLALHCNLSREPRMKLKIKQKSMIKRGIYSNLLAKQVSDYICVFNQLNKTLIDDILDKTNNKDNNSLISFLNMDTKHLYSNFFLGTLEYSDLFPQGVVDKKVMLFQDYLQTKKKKDTIKVCLLKQAATSFVEYYK